MMAHPSDAGLRTPFAKIDGALSALDAIELSVLVARSMFDTDGAQIRPDLAIWGTVAPNLGYSNIAREILIDADLDQTIPAFSTVMACSTSMIAAFEAASMLGTGGRNLALAGGVESMSRIQIGLDQRLSDWLRRFLRRAPWVSAWNRLPSSGFATSSCTSPASPIEAPG